MANPCWLADNVFQDGTPVASSTASGYNVLNILDRRPYTQWKSGNAGATVETIDVDAGTSVSADCLGIAGHNLSGCTVALQRSATGAWAGEELTVKTLNPTNNMFIFVGFTLVGAQYWRLKITTPTGNDAPFIGVLMAGERLEVERFPPGKIKPFTYKPKVNQKSSEAAYVLGVDVKHTKLDASVSVKHVTNEWWEDDFYPFWDANKRAPIFFAWDFDNWPDYIMLGQFVGNLAATYYTREDMEMIQIKLSGVNQ